MKSPLLRAFSVPDVHPRPRKRLSRCTLDCGFKTPESPALRGFVGGLRALATAALYLVLLSNGYKHPENRLKKFEFSLKITSTNLAKKLPSQRSISNRFSSRSSISLTNGPRSLSRVKAGTHSPFGERWHTAAYTPKHRASLLSLHGGLSLISHLGKQKPEEADARLWRVSASSGVAALPGCVTLVANSFTVCVFCP